jgi:xanthine dehydrogenase accessory factor
MDNRAIFGKAAAALQDGQQVALITVTATTGSTPGKVGYKMLVCERTPETAGTVGGGLVEAKMVAEARQMLGESARQLFQFELGTTPQDENGICGGSVEFLIETFDRTALPLFQELAAGGDNDTGGVLVSILSPEDRPRKIHVPSVLPTGTAPGDEFSPEITAAIKSVAATGEPGVRVSAGAMSVFIESLAAAPTVVLFGAGHLAYHIARYAQSVHFRIVVCDHRSEYANRQRFPEADEVLVADFARVFEKLRIDRDCYLVIVTRGHACDGIVLEQAVRTEARYIGMIGSKRKTAIVMQKLVAKGVPQERLDKVYSPVGLSVGALTPEEIALSIVAELVKIRRLGDEPPVGHMTLSRRGGKP